MGDIMFAATATSGVGGCIGIGTATPDSKLHIYAATAGSVTASSDSQLVVENSAIAGIQLLGATSSHGIIFFGDSGDAEDGRFGYDQSEQAFYFKTAGENTKKVYIGSDGNVGIGTEAPDYALDVAGDAGFDEYLYHNGDPDTYLKFDTNRV
jgi:hypothetical protein